jgi:hypothetical protein
MPDVNLVGYACMSAIPGIMIGAAWKDANFKDLSFKGACMLGYGHDGILNHALQVLNSYKDHEKHSSQRWNILALPIAANILYNSFVKEDGNKASLKEIPGRCFQVLKNSISNISFAATAIPLYNMARSLKNGIWTGQDFDPSGHVMFKVIQQGLLISTITSCTNNPKQKMLNGSFVLINILADTAMLANTTANCHTFNEVIVGASLGVGVITTALLINHCSQTLISNLGHLIKIKSR